MKHKFIVLAICILLLPLATEARINRGASWNEVCELIGGEALCTRTLYSGIMNYRKNNVYTPIDATIVNSTDENYDYEVVKGEYNAFFKEDPSTAQTIKYNKTQEVYYQPMFLIYRGDISQQQVSDIYSQSELGFPEQNRFVYPNALLVGTNLTYRYENEILKEEYILSDGSLPEPPEWVGGNVTLELHHLLSYGSNTKMFVNGIMYDEQGWITTDQEILFTDEYNNTIFYIPKAKAYDSNDSEIFVNLTVRFQNKKAYIFWQVPYEWLNSSDRVYPIYIDPTTQLQDANSENLEDTFLDEQNENTSYGTETYIEFCDFAADQKGMIKFNISLSLLPAEIDNVSLVLFNKTTASNDSDHEDCLRVYKVYNQSWNETNMTEFVWDSWDGTNKGGIIVPYTCWDADALQDHIVLNNASLTEFLQDEINDSEENISFMIEYNYMGGSSSSFKVNSKEYATVAKRPYLNVTYTATTPYISVNNPSNNSINQLSTVLLNVTLFDDGGDYINATFFNATGNDNMSIYLNRSNGSWINHSWSGLSWGTQYCWFVLTDDGTFSQNSSNYCFETDYYPNVTVSNMTSGTIYTNDTIYANFTIVDPDHTTGNLYIRWYVNSTNVYNQTNLSASNNTVISSSLSNGYFNKSDLINVSAWVNDTILNCSPQWSENLVTIANSIPFINNVTISPTPASASSNLTCNYSATDTDNDTLTIYYNWTINETLSAYHTENLSAGNTTTGQNITCSVKVGDGTANSSWSTSALIVLGDSTDPTMNNYSLSDTTGYNGTTEYVYVDCTDSDSEIKINYPKVSFQLPNGSTAGNYSMTLLSGIHYRYSISITQVGTYSDFTFYCCDSQSNCVGNTTGLQYISTEQPIEGGGGGGGAGVTIEQTTVIEGTVCGDGVCETGETAFSCPQDCTSANFDVFGSSKVLQFMVFIFIIALLYGYYTKYDKSKKRWKWDI